MLSRWAAVICIMLVEPFCWLALCGSVDRFAIVHTRISNYNQISISLSASSAWEDLLLATSDIKKTSIRNWRLDCWLHLSALAIHFLNSIYFVATSFSTFFPVAIISQVFLMCNTSSFTCAHTYIYVHIYIYITYTHRLVSPNRANTAVLSLLNVRVYISWTPFLLLLSECIHWLRTEKSVHDFSRGFLFVYVIILDSFMHTCNST